MWRHRRIRGVAVMRARDFGGPGMDGLAWRAGLPCLRDTLASTLIERRYKHLYPLRDLGGESLRQAGAWEATLSRARLRGVRLPSSIHDLRSSLPLRDSLASTLTERRYMHLIDSGNSLIRPWRRHSTTISGGSHFPTPFAAREDCGSAYSLSSHSRAAPAVPRYLCGPPTCKSDRNARSPLLSRLDS